MPLTSQYTWSETEGSLEVVVTVPGVSRAKADVFATSAFLKVNCPPYLFALDLAQDVDDARSTATLLPGRVVFTLTKVRAAPRAAPAAALALPPPVQRPSASAPNPPRQAKHSSICTTTCQ
jgi:hypothetical protein